MKFILLAMMLLVSATAFADNQFEARSAGWVNVGSSLGDNPSPFCQTAEARCLVGEGKCPGMDGKPLPLNDGAGSTTQLEIPEAPSVVSNQ